MAEDECKTPYANEMLLLSFEGQHKKFEVSYETDSGGPPQPPLSSIQFIDRSLLGRLKKIVGRLLKRT